jgi:hypothetical protein
LRFTGAASHARAIETAEALAMTTMTRRQLYDLIWAKPMRDAAADIGISDVGLKKVCIRHRVPVPPQGYWNKVHAGQKPSKAIFREVDDAGINLIEIAGSSYDPPPAVGTLVRSVAEPGVAGSRLGIFAAHRSRHLGHQIHSWFMYAEISIPSTSPTKLANVARWGAWALIATATATPSALRYAHRKLETMLNDVLTGFEAFEHLPSRPLQLFSVCQ